jgi:hypothetical protein
MPYYRIDMPNAACRLVEAENAAGALRHVAQSVFTVSKPLKQGELVELLGLNVKVEKAGEAPPEEKVDETKTTGVVEQPPQDAKAKGGAAGCREQQEQQQEG